MFVDSIFLLSQGIFLTLAEQTKNDFLPMSKIPDVKEFTFRDTSFANLMNKRIYNVLLLATKYDAFMLEDDGRVDEQVFNEYTSLSLSSPPRFTPVSYTHLTLPTNSLV